MSSPNDIEPMRCQGFGGDARAEIALQPRRPRRAVLAELVPIITGCRSRKVLDVGPLVLDDFPDPG
ncbi:MAG: hypothetical protein EBS94_11785 [Proteobacteria bacterium]|nr:hypothetical protein [Pseudomonadota bacterium]